jgi:hypothetical protein
MLKVAASMKEEYKKTHDTNKNNPINQNNKNNPINLINQNNPNNTNNKNNRNNTINGKNNNFANNNPILTLTPTPISTAQPFIQI